MKTGFKSAAIAASSLFLFSLAPAYASADSDRAEAYFDAIAGGDADNIASFYADDAEFRWVGGPLAGVYKGKAKIKAVWEKFAAAAGDISHEVQQLSETASGNTSTITARVTFKGEGEVPVKFVLVYKDGKIASEVWQVDKSGAVTAKAESKPEAKPDDKAEPEETAASAVPLPEARPADAPAGAVQAAVITERPAAAEDASRRLAAKDEARDSGKPGPADGEYLPQGNKAGDTADSEAAPSDVPVPAARKTEGAPGKDGKAEPKAKTAAAPKAKAPDAKKGGYAEKPDDRKVARKKRYYGDDYAYDGYRRGYYGGGYGRYDDDYGYGGRGYGRWGRYGYGYSRYGYGGYGWGRYGGNGGYGGYGGGY